MSIFLLLFVLNNQETLDLFIVAESNIFFVLFSSLVAQLGVTWS